jgi:quinol-cytochrome oxidoreductase complex cytochrome b subunit
MPGYGPPVGQMPSTHRAWAITCIVGGVLFCLILGLPFGIVANYYAGKVQQSWDMGDAVGAMSASKRALTWNILATVFIALGVIFVIIELTQIGKTSS